ncbi:amidase [Reyranella sp.]|uniref:amidase n=1 Tax=Reyranella sp. TaxID=1929291 RepID=UPI003D0CE4E5
MKLHEKTLTELAAGLSAKKFSSREIADALLARIEKVDGKLHAFTEVYAKEARALAGAADTARASSFPLGPLHGLPMVYKDLCDIKGRIGTGGSKMWENRVATETSATVERLTAAGMFPLGKLHMVEFAFGGWGTNPLMGAPWNPWDLETHRTPGGSSSGTGVAVAARLAPAGIGSDTGGSVRIPCAFNGLVGLKVTFGRISLHGTMLLSWTLDSIGPMARSVEDCALLLNALAAPDPRDPTTLDQPLEDFTAAAKGGSIEGMRLALPDSSQLPDFVDPDVVRAWQSAARTFEELGATVEAVRLPGWFFEMQKGAGTISTSEMFSLHRKWIEDKSKPIGDGVRGRALLGKNFVTGGYAEELRFMKQRRAEFAEWMRPYDALLTPTVAVPAIPLTEVDETSPVSGYMTRPGNYLGLCALSMPSGLSRGLPVGIQIFGKPYAERDVLKLGKAFQDATDFHRRAPDLSSLGL